MTPTKVVSAGHRETSPGAFNTANFAGIPLRQIDVVPAYSISRFSWQPACAAQGLSIDSQWLSSGFEGEDLAVIRVSSSCFFLGSAGYFGYQMSGASGGLAAHSSGYPMDRHSGWNWDSPGTQHHLAEQMLVSDQVCAVGPSNLPTRLDVIGGHSGGPIWRFNNPASGQPCTYLCIIGAIDEGWHACGGWVKNCLHPDATDPVNHYNYAVHVNQEKYNFITSSPSC